MRDMFDDFMEELRRREAQVRGETPPDPGNDGGRDDGGDDDDTGGDDPDRDDEPERIDQARPARQSDERPPRRRPPGGPDDGRDDGGTGRRIGLGVGIAIVAAIIILFSFGLDLWTDALWYASVGFDGVFWTRLGIPGRVVRRRPRHRAHRPARQPVAGGAPEPAARRGDRQPAGAHRPLQRGSAGERRDSARSARIRRDAAAHHVRGRGHPRPDAARRGRPDRLRDLPGRDHRRLARRRPGRRSCSGRSRCPSPRPAPRLSSIRSSAATSATSCSSCRSCA